MSLALDRLDVEEDDKTAIARLKEIHQAQKRAFIAHPYPTFAEREALVNAVVGMVLSHRQEMKDALHADFGWHPEPIADLIEVLGMASRAQYTLAELPKWMAEDRREIDPGMWGAASATVRYQPKGVIGNMVPWNFPFDIGFGPLIDMLAAGNRVILKPSDLGPNCGALMASMIASTFDENQVAVSLGGFELAKAFPSLAWDHLMFTGSPATGKKVMEAAAQNLVPVTLELGGKSPAIVTAGAVNEATVTNLIGMKLLKSGQVCVAPDHVFVPRTSLDTFIELVRTHVSTNLPGHTASDDSTGIISDRHLDRLLAMVDQARDAGYEVIQPEVGASTNREKRQTPLTLVVNPGPELDVMKEEIFGPILPVIAYDDLDEVIASLNAGERPLGLYVYSHDEAIISHVLESTTSGGVCVNLSLIHGAIPQLPFGGIGNSGMGRHHSVEAFREFSNARGVLVRGSAPDNIDAINPPYRSLEGMISAIYAQIDAG
ncbi:MAG: aldehyde dehydrogenase [Homoserinimonas sp.]|nr:aldehyde dehydrogenase [Homoserinimonas sp.]